MSLSENCFSKIIKVKDFSEQSSLKLKTVTLFLKTAILELKTQLCFLSSTL